MDKIALIVDTTGSKAKASATMGRPLKIGAVAVVAAVIVGVVTASLLLRSHQAPPQLALSGTPAIGSASALNGKWSVGAGSQVGYRVKEKFINQPAETEAVARTSKITGAVTVGVRDSTVSISAMKFTVDLASLTSQDKYANYQVYQRDFFVRSIYLQTDVFPTATFSAATASFPVPAGGQVDVDISGNLNVHGITKTVVAHVQAQAAGYGAEVAGSMVVDMRDFGVEPPDISFTRAEPMVTIEFDLKLVHA